MFNKLGGLCFILFLLIVHCDTTGAQDYERLLFERDSIYNANVRKSRIDGVYIPKDFEDAFVELDRLSEPEDRAKFKLAEEDLVARKLHFGLGRWMSVKWNFDQGSRLVAKMKALGVHYPEDMIDFMLRVYHRYLNGTPLEAEKLGESYAKKREAEKEAKKAKGEVIEETTIRKKRG